MKLQELNAMALLACLPAGTLSFFTTYFKQIHFLYMASTFIQDCITFFFYPQLTDKFSEIKCDNGKFQMEYGI